MVSAVAGIFSVLFAPCCALDPRMAALVHLVLGTIALVTGLVTYRRVSAGRIDSSNLFQARIGLCTCAVAYSIAVAWGVWIQGHPDGIPG